MRATDIRALLKASYTSPEWAVFFEVHDRTGGGNRSADAIAVNMWPSRGCAIHGFEIKVSKSDWKAELSNPAKAEMIGKYCDYWNIVAPAGLIEVGEVPEMWGLINAHHGKLRQAKQAPKNPEPEPLNRLFVAALLRRYTHGISEDVEKEIDARVRVELGKRAQKPRASFHSPTPSIASQNALQPPTNPYEAKYIALKEDRDAFLDMTGIKFTAYGGQGHRLGKAIMAMGIRSPDPYAMMKHVEQMLSSMKDLHEALQNGTEFREKKDVMNDKRMKQLLAGDLTPEARQEVADWIFHLAGFRGGTNDL